MTPNPPKYVVVASQIVRGLVTLPDAVNIEHTTDERGVKLTIIVDPVDVSRVIGKAGQTAEAIRTILRAVGATCNARVGVIIQDPNPEKRGQKVPQNARMSADDLGDI